MMVGRVKWWLADRLNRLPGQCWSDLVNWAMHSYRDDPDWRSAVPWRPIGFSCRKDAAMNGRCYCGKLGACGGLLATGETIPDMAQPFCQTCGLHHAPPIHYDKAA